MRTGAFPHLPFLALLALLSCAPAAQGHGLVNAGELEILVVQDEASDAITGLQYGFDLVQIYLGEAHVPGLGDGLYLHTVLYGGAGERPLVDGPQSVRFELGFGDRGLERIVERTLHFEGGAFHGDFDLVEAEVRDGEAEVQRAFLAYPDGIGPGSVLRSLRATSMVDGEPRDVAPGGVVLPGTNQEVAMGESGQVVESHTLRGPVGYLAQVEVVAMQDEPGAFLVTAWSGLKQGSQHILLAAGPRDGWSASVDGAGGDTPPGGSQSFVVRLVPPLGEGAQAPANLTLDLTTDIGGHATLLASQGPDGLRLGAPGWGPDAVQRPADAKESPAAPAVAALGLAAALLLARKAQR